MLIPRKYHSIVVAAVLLIVSLAVLSYSATRLSETGLLRKLVLEAAAPVEDAINVSLKGLHDAWKRYLFLVGLEDENRRLRRENAVLNEQLNRYREGYLEGERLRKLLDLTGRLSTQAVAARVVDNNRTSLFKTILINKGTADGLRVGLPVLSDQGVVGRIIETSWHASRVLLLIDENSNIDALIQRSRAQGILQGGGSAGCNLKYISRVEEVQTGDVVLSSGLAGVFPKGLLLGIVTEASRKEGGLFQKIDVAPAVDFGKLEEVLILILPDGDGGDGEKTMIYYLLAPILLLLLVIVQITILDLLSLGWIAMEISLIVVIYAGLPSRCAPGRPPLPRPGFFSRLPDQHHFRPLYFSVSPHLFPLHDRRGKDLRGKALAHRHLHRMLHASGRPDDRSALPHLLRHRHSLCDPEDLYPAGHRGGSPEPPLLRPFPPIRGFSACRRYTTGSTVMSRVSSKANSGSCSSSSRSR